MEAAPRTAAHNGGEPGERPMTRHGMIQLPTTDAQPAAKYSRVSMMIIVVDRVTTSRGPGLQHRAEAQQSGLSASNPVPPGDASAIADIRCRSKSP